MIDPVHGGKEHLVFTVNPQELRGYELAEKVFVDIMPLLFLADKVEIVVDVVECQVLQIVKIVSLSKSVDS